LKQSAVLQTINESKLTRSADSSMGVRPRWSNVRQPQNCWATSVKCLVGEQVTQTKAVNLIITRKHLKCEYIQICFISVRSTKNSKNYTPHIYSKYEYVCS